MNGTHPVIVQNNQQQFKFVLCRNITILRGDSATGKTTLVDMIQMHQDNGADSGINISCDKACTVLNGTRWRQNLKSITDSIVFIDEGNPFIRSDEFISEVKNSDNYYVIVTRENLPNLPYSINEIYGIRNVGKKKYPGFVRLYSEFYPLHKEKVNEIGKPDIVIVEDSGAGYDFYRSVCGSYNIPCISASGKSNIFRMLTEGKSETVLVIADGAAFGPEIEPIVRLRKRKNIILLLPESFEWIILKSGLIAGVGKILDNPSEYIHSEKFFSWEQFFAALLVERSQGTYLAYKKSRLNPSYLLEKETGRILQVFSDIGK